MDKSDIADLHASDVASLAVNLARNCGYAVFPVKPDKRPACPHGFEDAAKDSVAVRELWRRWPAPLVGVATGSVSGVWVLDIDCKHQAAVDWWHGHWGRLVPTRVYRTRSGGLHLYFRGGEGLRNSAGRPVRGVDVRGDGGYVVAWFCAGHDCLDASQPAPWPDWLRRRVERVAAPAPAVRASGGSESGAWLRGVLDKLDGAQEGERNALLHWCACRLYERGLRQVEVERLLLPAAIARGLADPEARRTIASASRSGGV